MTPAGDALSESCGGVIERSRGKLRGRLQFKGGLFSEVGLSRLGIKGNRLGPALSTQPGPSERLISYLLVPLCCSKAAAPDPLQYYCTANGNISFCWITPGRLSCLTTALCKNRFHKKKITQTILSIKSAVLSRQEFCLIYLIPFSALIFWCVYFLLLVLTSYGVNRSATPPAEQGPSLPSPGAQQSG